MVSKNVFRERFWKMVEKEETIVITGHVGPDDDSVASVLAVYWLIKEKFPKKKMEMVCTGEQISAFESFKGFGKIRFVEELVDWLTTLRIPPRKSPYQNTLVAPVTPGEAIRPLTGETSASKPLVIMLDGSQFDRFSRRPEKLKKLAGKTICIDHHSSPIDDFDLSLVDSSASSCAEIIYCLFHKNKEVDKKLAEIYLLGILGDTGNFTYLKPNQTETLLIAKKLIEVGEIEIQELQSRYQQYSKKVFGLMGELMSNTRYFDGVGEWPPFQVSFLSKAGDDKDVSKASHLYIRQYLKSIKGYNWGFVITSREDGSCSVSFRSLPGVVNVRKLAEKFNGGGHDLASGGEVEVSDPEKVLEVILSSLRQV